MDVEAILLDFKQRRDQLEEVISALERLEASSGKPRRRPATQMDPGGEGSVHN